VGRFHPGDPAVGARWRQLDGLALALADRRRPRRAGCGRVMEQRRSDVGRDPRRATVAVLSTALPYSLELQALRRLDTRVFGVLLSMEPAVAALAGFVLRASG
jgi:inner membrane transporter RhtA